MTFWVCAKKSPYTPADNTVPVLEDMTFGRDSTFEVVTWNVEQFPKQYGTTLDYLTTAMLVLDAEVYALQEISSQSYFNQLVDDLNMIDTVNTWAGYRSTEASYDLNLAMIYKSSGMTIQSLEEVFTDDWYAFPRPPLVMNLIWNNRHLVVIDNHFKASGGEQNEARRREASEKLQEFVETYYPDDNVIIVGDLNDEIQEPQESNVFWNFIEDSVSYKFVDMSIARDATRRYWSYPSWPSHLDHILVTNELFDEMNNDGSVVKTIRVEDYLEGGWTEYDMYITDHRPVAIRLRF